MKWFRFPLCLAMLCPCRPYEDDGGCGGECIHCGKIFGYTSRADISAYIEIQEIRKALRDAR